MNPTAILTADIHLRTDRPAKRTDNYFAAQANKIEFIRDLQEEYKCPIFDGGDLFHRWNSSPYLEAWAIENLPNDIHTVAGNHELLEHNINNLEKASLNVLSVANKIKLLCSGSYLTVVTEHRVVKLSGFPWNTPLKSAKEKRSLNVALIHHMITDEDLKYKDDTALKAHTLFKKMEGFDLIVCGHNHKPFVVEQDGRLIVSPGSMMRTTKGQMEHRPRVYLWYAGNNTVKPMYLPIEKDVFAVTQIRKEEESEKRIESFILALKEEYEVTLSFKKNMENYLAGNKTVKSVEEIIWECVP